MNLTNKELDAINNFQYFEKDKKITKQMVKDKDVVLDIIYKLKRRVEELEDECVEIKAGIATENVKRDYIDQLRGLRFNYLTTHSPTSDIRYFWEGVAEKDEHNIDIISYDITGSQHD